MDPKITGGFVAPVRDVRSDGAASSGGCSTDVVVSMRFSRLLATSRHRAA